MAIATQFNRDFTEDMLLAMRRDSLEQPELLSSLVEKADLSELEFVTVLDRASEPVVIQSGQTSTAPVRVIRRLVLSSSENSPADAFVDPSGNSVSVPDFSRFDTALRLPAIWNSALTESQRTVLREIVDAPDAWVSCVQIFPPSVQEALDGTGHDLLSSGASEADAVRATKVVDRLRARNRFPSFAGWRRVVLASKELDGRLAMLAGEFPNFAEVVEFLRDQLALSSARDGRLHFTPILLSGPPGIGKTGFVSRLSEMIGVARAVFIDIASVQTGASLSGSDEFWSNSKPGAVFEAVVAGEWASPVVVLDEIDKAQSFNSREDPLGPLYRLLEGSSAKRFEDLSFPRITFDASRVFWFATANNCSGIPAPLLSRFMTFEVKAPDRLQTQVIARRIFRNMVAGMKPAPTATPEVFEQLSGQSVRDLKRILEGGLAKAIRAGERQLRSKYLNTSAPHERSMGFL